MIIKSNLHASGDILGNYVIKKGVNENVETLDIHGSTQDDPRMAVLEMEMFKRMTKAKYGLEHIQVCPDYDQGIKMSRQNWMLCIDQVLRNKHYVSKKGEYRPYVATLHEKIENRIKVIHMHLVVQRYNPETRKMNDCKNSYRDNDRARAAIEEKLNHKKTRLRNPDHKIIRDQLTKLWKATKSGNEFIREAFKLGYLIAKGGANRPFQAVNWDAIGFDLVKKLTGYNTEDVRKRLGHIKLPTLKEAIIEMRSRKTEQELNKSQITAKDFINKKQQENIDAKKKAMKDQFDEITKKKRGPSL